MQKKKKIDLHFNQNTARKHWTCAFFQVKKQLINNNRLSVEVCKVPGTHSELFSSSYVVPQLAATFGHCVIWGSFSMGPALF